MVSRSVKGAAGVAVTMSERVWGVFGSLCEEVCGVLVTSVSGNLDFFSSLAQRPWIRNPYGDDNRVCENISCLRPGFAIYFYLHL